MSSECPSGWNPGDEYYLRDGRTVAYIVQARDGSHIVREVLSDDEGYGNVLQTTELFGEPPTVKRHERIAELDLEIRRRTKRINDMIEQEQALQKGFRSLKAEIDERERLLSKNRAFQRLQQFIAGEITHVVREDYDGYRIATLAETLKAGYDTLKLVTLFGGSNGHLDWRVNDYKDLSGGFRKIVPFTSLEEAQQFVQAQFDLKFQKQVAEHSPYLGNTVKAAQAQGFIRVPADALARVEEADRADRQRKIERLEKELQDARRSA